LRQGQVNQVGSSFCGVVSGVKLLRGLLTTSVLVRLWCFYGNKL